MFSLLTLANSKASDVVSALCEIDNELVDYVMGANAPIRCAGKTPCGDTTVCGDGCTIVDCVKC